VVTRAQNGPRRRSAQPFWCIRQDMSAENDIFGPGAVMVLDLVVAHFSRDRLLEHRKRATEAAAFIRLARRHELDASHLAQENGLEKNGSSISEALAVRSLRSVVQALCSPTLCGNSAHGNSSTLTTSC
jgi:hypothetical protein